MKKPNKLYSAYIMILKNGYQVLDLHPLNGKNNVLVKVTRNEMLEALNIKDFEIELKQKGLRLPRHKARLNHLYKMGFFIDEKRNKKKAVHMNLDHEIIVIQD